MKEVKEIFKIDQSFNITDRGVVVTGHFIEGSPLIGYFLVVDIGGQPATVKITGIERGKLMQTAECLGDYFYISMTFPLKKLPRSIE